MQNKIELRNYDVSLSGVEETSEGLFLVRGLVNKTNAWSQPLTTRGGKKFVERIVPKTFNKALQRGNEVRFLAEHDPKKLLASTKNGSLTLQETNEGLVMEARISPTSWGKDYHQLIEDGLLTNMSFGMQVLKDDWKKENGINQRSITDLALFEVSCVLDPAYTDSQISARDLKSAEDVEIPQINQTEKRSSIFMNLDGLTIRQLQEMKSKKYNESKEILSAEVRSLNDGQAIEREIALDEIRAIDEQIAELKADKKSFVKEDRKMENTFTKEKELRAVAQFIRKQDGQEIQELRSVTMGATPGSLTVPTTLSNMIVEKLFEAAPIFSRTRNFTPVNGYLEVLREQSIGTAGFVGEMTSINPNDFAMDKIRLDQKRVGTAIELSQHLVNDSGIDIVGYATKLLTKRLGLTLDRNVLNGKVATEFEGILGSVSPQDITTAGVASISIDDLLETFNNMHPSLVDGSVWVMNRQTFNVIAKLKDGMGHYWLVRDNAETGVTYKLFGQSVLICDAMPDLITGNRAVALVNFDEGYVTMTKQGLSLQHISGDTTQSLRGSHLLLLDGYMDGKILNPDAIKFLKIK